MLKLIIAEDEAFTRNKLTEIIDWNALGFEIAGLFENGNKVLEYLKTNTADVLLTDIQMNGISGIELTEKLKETHPNILIVYISAYRDFEYAHSAIKFGIHDYLLKPVTYEKIYNCFLNISEKFSKKENVHTDFELMLKRMNFISDLVSKEITDIAEIQENFKNIGINVDVKNCMIATFTIKILNLNDYLNHIWHHSTQQLYSALNNFLHSEEENAYFIPYEYAFNNIKMIAISKDNNKFKDSIDVFFKDSSQKLNDNLKMETVFSDPNFLKNIFKLKTHSSTNTIATHFVNMVISRLSGNDLENVLTPFNSFISIYGNNTSVLKDFSEQLTASVIETYGIKLLTSWNIKINEYENLKTSEEFKEYIEYFIKKIMDNLKDREIYSQKSPIIAAKEFINSHYNENITLQTVAYHVGMTSSYFSQYFQKKTNEKYIDYLTNIRIEKAKQLLTDSDYKIYEICEMVGYKKLDHFSSLFKHYTGKTPSQFRSETG